jgi:hypothetical protein
LEDVIQRLTGGGGVAGDRFRALDRFDPQVTTMFIGVSIPSVCNPTSMSGKLSGCRPARRRLDRVSGHGNMPNGATGRNTYLPNG